jgi:hypothetical protein
MQNCEQSETTHGRAICAKEYSSLNNLLLAEGTPYLKITGTGKRKNTWDA